jgi:hypothetical protein
MKAYDRAGADITADLFAASGFLKVDADYTPKRPGRCTPSCRTMTGSPSTGAACKTPTARSGWPRTGQGSLAGTDA